MAKSDRKSAEQQTMDEETKQFFEKELERWEAVTQPLVDAIHDSERLSDKDYSIRINTRG